MTWWLDRPIAHRGLHGGDAIPENSLPAFAACKARALPAELDVTLLRDGSVAVFHDDSLERMTAGRGPIADLDARGVKKLKLRGSDHAVPLLPEVLGLIDGAVGLLIEIKNKGAAGRAEEAILGVLEGYGGPFAIQSFNPRSLMWFKDNAPHVTRGQLSGDLRDGDSALYKRLLFRHFSLTRKGDPAFIGCDVRCLPARRVTRLRQKGTPVLGWTVRNQAELRRARHHCDNIIFEGFLPDWP